MHAHTKMLFLTGYGSFESVVCLSDLILLRVLGVLRGERLDSS